MAKKKKSFFKALGTFSKKVGKAYEKFEKHQSRSEKKTFKKKQRQLKNLELDAKIAKQKKKLRELSDKDDLFGGDSLF